MRLDRSRAAAYLFAVLAVAITVFMVIYPETAFSAALYGLRAWWDIVFPALLPFFIGSQILMGLGVVHFMGVLLEPLMRPLFNVPGAGSFVLAMGLASGYPIGAILTAGLLRQGLVDRREGERLMSFANTADPLFMGGAVAVGMFRRPDTAWVIIAAHYLSSLGVGLILRFYSRGKQGGAPVAGPRGRPAGAGLSLPPRPPAPSLARALEALYEARRRDGRPFGQLLGDSVKGSVNTLLMVGGFIILFSTVIRILDAVGIVGAVASALGAVLGPIGAAPALSRAAVSGLLEITIGCQQAAQAAAPLSPRLVIAGAVIAWSGLSVHAQVAAIIQGTGMSLLPYVGARVIHALLAGMITAVMLSLAPLGGGSRVQSAAGLTAGVPAAAGGAAPLLPGPWLGRLGLGTEAFLATVLALGMACALSLAGRRLHVVWLYQDGRLRPRTRRPGRGG
ncbi:MAG: sporulation integral membrane protein YlbJ [Acetobacteraceae bacterium]|nr:sporulation integral membrane protein YlbJ [Acetobacteraceae bacterium]